MTNKPDYVDIAEFLAGVKLPYWQVHILKKMTPQYARKTTEDWQKNLDKLLTSS